MTISGCHNSRIAVDEAMQKRVNEYAKIKLTADISKLSDNDRKLLPYLIEAAQIMDDLYWKQTFGDKDGLLDTIRDPAAREFALINYGPWDRLSGDSSFVQGFEAKPLGANFYPKDMKTEEFEKLTDKAKTSEYTIIVRNADGALKVIPYHEAYKAEIEKAAGLMKKAAGFADDPGLKKYLNLRAEALLTDNYFESDIAWMDMKNNSIDFVVGPIENYEDGLFGYKAAYESYILIKDKEWSKKLEKYAALLPQLQAALPVSAEYKKELPGSDSDLGVYDAVYYAGDCNAGSKTIAINLPNNEKVQEMKGSRKLQLRNNMQFKFDQIVVPIGNILIDESERGHIKFNSFFENTMFHEVAHGLGIKNIIKGEGTVREALKEQYSSLEEAKADILGLFLVSELVKAGELKNTGLMDNYVTFLAGIFRSVRFGISSAHGKANMLTFYYFEEKGAFTRDATKGTYKVNFDKMKDAVGSLANKIIVIQGNGDYDAAQNWIEQNGNIKEALQKDLDRVGHANIPKDIIFEQGVKELGL